MKQEPPVCRVTDSRSDFGHNLRVEVVADRHIGTVQRLERPGVVGVEIGPRLLRIRTPTNK